MRLKNPVFATLGVLGIFSISLSLLIHAGLALPAIRSDGFGYFSYLSSVFIDHDLSFRSALNSIGAGVNAKEAFGLGIHPETGKMFVKYLPGVAILAAPFYLLADITTLWLGLPRTGDSTAYQIAATIAVNFYLLVGIWAIFKTARLEHGPLLSSVVVTLIVFATNVYHYAVYEVSMAHIYSFSVVALYVRELMLYRHKLRPYSVGFAIRLGILVGLITLIRATDAIVVVLAAIVMFQRPANMKSPQELIVRISAFVAAGLVTISPLLAFWRFSTGSFIVNSYKIFPVDGVTFEGFDWTKPELTNFLFSIDRGVFFWAPIILIGFIGLIPMIKKTKGWGCLIFFVLISHVYICSSWWVWHFGLSFGARPMIDVMPLVALPLAVILAELIKAVRQRYIIVAALMFVSVNLLLTVAFWRGAVPSHETTLTHLQQLPWRLFSDFLVSRNLASNVNIGLDGQIIGHTLKISVNLSNEAKTRFESFSSKGETKIAYRFVPTAATVGPTPEVPWQRKDNLLISLSSGEATSKTFELDLPASKEDFLLEVTLVQEGVNWFHALGMQKARLLIVDHKIVKPAQILKTDMLVDQDIATAIKLNAAAEIAEDFLKVQFAITNTSELLFSTESRKSPINVVWRFLPVGQLNLVSDTDLWRSIDDVNFALSPGETYTDTVFVSVPKLPGEYVLEISLGQHGVAWFHHLGMQVPQATVIVP